MAKRGGFPGGIPGNMNNMLKQVQRIQRQMEEAQARIEETVYSGTAGGGAVAIDISGKLEVKKVHIDPDACDPEDSETLEDLITAALNEAFAALDKAREELESKSGAGGLGGGFGGLPGGF